MVDVVDTKTRSRMMSGIKSKNTRPELLIRKALFDKGFRYRLHAQYLPGKPDLVLPNYNAVIFIHGCFWHGHDCHLFKWPSTRPDFWKSKINRNQEVDIRAYKNLIKDGWYILTIWECALKGKTRRPLEYVVDNIEYWLLYETKNKQIKGIKCK
jgi:DNA mismatch endonuclease, patch repair protein